MSLLKLDCLLNPFFKGEGKSKLSEVLSDNGTFIS